MKATLLSRRSDDTGHYLHIAFTRDGETVEKRMRLSGNRQENVWTLAKYVREADVDIAVKLHGHCWGTRTLYEVLADTIFDDAWDGELAPRESVIERAKRWLVQVGAGTR
jgi:nitrous oxidase accessory protein NosD